MAATSPPAEYWATLAQVIPVVGLALVATVQWSIRIWETRDFPAGFRILMSWLWGLDLVALTICQVIVIAAIRTGEAPQYTATLAEFALAVGFGATVFNSGMNLIVGAHARPLGRLMAKQPLTRRRTLKLHAEIRNLMARTLRAEAEIRNALDQQASLIEEFEMQIQELEEQYADQAAAADSVTVLFRLAELRQNLDEQHAVLAAAKENHAERERRHALRAVVDRAERREYFARGAYRPEYFAQIERERARDLEKLLKDFSLPAPPPPNP